MPDGRSRHPCSITGIPSKPPFNITLNLRAVALQRGYCAKSGNLHIRRQQVDNNLDQVIERALRKKLPKLANTPADKRILLLERQHMILLPESILAEVENQRRSFPKLADVNEIWILETPFYGTAFGGNHLRFERYENGDEVVSFDFGGGELMTRYEDGVAEIIQQEP
jgi:hypothetical protein